MPATVNFHSNARVINNSQLDGRRDCRFNHITLTLSLMLVPALGEGSMSISNALGANTLDILLCLGLPWFIKSLMPASMNGGPVHMETNDLFFNCICMIISVVVLNIAAAANGFKMYKIFGIICLVGHVAIITVFIISGLNVAKNPANKQC